MPYKDPEKRLAYWNEWRRKHPERVRGYQRKYQEKNPQARRRNHIKCRYGLTLEAYAEMLAAQDGKCAACRVPVEAPYVDHNHTTGEVRGLLCPGCNMVCGSLENPRLAACQAYLKKYPSLRPEEVQTWTTATPSLRISVNATKTYSL